MCPQPGTALREQAFRQEVHEARMGLVGQIPEEDAVSCQRPGEAPHMSLLETARGLRRSDVLVISLRPYPRVVAMLRKTSVAR